MQLLDFNLNLTQITKISKVTKIIMQRNWVFATNSNFLIPISMQPDVANLWYFKPLIFQTCIIWSNRIHSLKYLRFTTLGCKDKGIRKSEFVTKTQFKWTNCSERKRTRVVFWAKRFKLYKKGIRFPELLQRNSTSS